SIPPWLPPSTRARRRTCLSIIWRVWPPSWTADPAIPKQELPSAACLRRGVPLLLHLPVDPPGAEFGVDDLLFAVQPVVAREHVGHPAARGAQGEAPAAEERKGQHQGGEGAVGGPAEHRRHPQRPAEAVGQAQQGTRQ